MAYKLPDINAAVRRDPVVLLSGPSGSGKTTTAEKISQELVRAFDLFEPIDPKLVPSGSLIHEFIG